MARILLVDDDPATLDVLQFALELDGHETFTAVNGREGVDKALELRPDLIVLDSMMPVMDGLAAARELRDTAEIAETPVIMLTAKAMNSDVWSGWQAGVDSYVTKPLDIQILAEEMARIGVAAVAGDLAEVR